jgi:hypothetical protein
MNKVSSGTHPLIFRKSSFISQFSKSLIVHPYFEGFWKNPLPFPLGFAGGWLLMIFDLLITQMDA